MNYLREINAFIDWLETNPLEASTQTLWFHLMAIANKSGWPEWFTVANPLLQAKVGVSENTLIKHRNFLAQRGRIEYRSMGKQKAGKYRIISFTSDITSNFEAKREVKCEAKYEVKPAVNHEVKGSALFKLNETKENNSNSVDNPNPFRLFESEGFGTISGIIREKLGDLIDDYGERWVCEAMKSSVFSGKRSLTYVNGILQRWKADGVDQPWTVPFQPGRRQRDRAYPRSNGTSLLKPVIPIASAQSAPKGLSEEEMDAIINKAERWNQEE